jgi:mono/diheme cytochrome c family protein
MRSLRLVLMSLLICTAAANAEVDKKAERNWKSKCSSCHGADGKGQTDQGKKMHVEDMSTADWQKKPDADIRKAISDGAKKGDAVMDGFKDKLDAAQIDGLVAYVRTLKK